MKLQRISFVVDETPYALWDSDIRGLNRRFLNGIDPNYFRHIAEVHGPLLDTENKQYAAVALRSAYAHGLETLFALVGASLQSPECPMGWMLKYKTCELFSLIRKINTHKPVLHSFDVDRLSWETIVEVLFVNFSKGDEERDQQIRKCFSRLWQRFANDFLDKDYSKEYNSVKHGLRVGMGGFTLALGVEDTPGVLCPPERMKSLGGSIFGTEFYDTEDLVDHTNFRAKRKSLNWSPENLIGGLQLIAVSIGNVISALKIINGVEADQVEFYSLTSVEDYDSPWHIPISMKKFEMNPILSAEWIEPLSKTEIKSSYSEQRHRDKSET